MISTQAISLSHAAAYSTINNNIYLNLGVQQGQEMTSPTQKQNGK